MKHLSKLLFFALIPFGTFAQWNKDTTVRNPVCTAVKSQYYPRNCSDGNGGAIFTWVDERNSGSFASAYAQKITRTGKTSWTANGALVYDGVANNAGVVYSTTVSDGSGGAIIILEVSVIGGANQLFAQHINASGSLLWGSGGIKITDVADSRMRWAEDPEQDGISADGSGGVFVTWQAYQSSYFVYAQHIDNNGNLLWGSSGVGIAVSAGYRSTIQNTGSGTAVVGYSNLGGGSFYMQRLAADGSFLWGSAGLLVSNQYVTQDFEPAHILTYDAVNSVIMAAFLVSPSANISDVYVQKFDLNGNALWKAGGVNTTASNTENSEPDILPDNKGGIFLCYTNGKETVQHISTAGKKTWGAGGIAVDNTPSTDQHSPVMVSDGSGGIITVYKTSRNGAGYYSVYTQRFHASGVPAWRINGVPVIIGNADINHEVNTTVASTKGYAITCWHDSRNAGDNNDIYAARVGGTQGFGLEAPGALADEAVADLKTSVQVRAYPNPAASVINISFGLERAESGAAIAIYNISGVRVKQLALGSLPAGNHTASLGVGGLPAGIYQAVLTCGEKVLTTKFEVVR